MARLKVGDVAPAISTVDIDSLVFSLEKYRGKKVLLSFYRFATCPFCNLRIHAMAKEYATYKEHFEIVAIFESPTPSLKRVMDKKSLPFPVLSDSEGLYYRAYGLEKSFWGAMKGMLFRMPTLMKSMMMGNFPTRVDASMMRKPADFLIDEKGKIEIAHYGNDAGDHLDVAQWLKKRKRTK